MFSEYNAYVQINKRCTIYPLNIKIMEQFIKKWVWTILAFEEGKEIPAKILTWKNKYRAGMQYQVLAARYDNVLVFDPDGDYNGPCEL